MNSFQKGLKAALPIAIGYVPVAITFGMTALAIGLDKISILMASVLIFAGSAQFALITIIPHSLVSALIIPILLNLRHIVYGAVVSKEYEIQKPLITAFGLTDEVFAASLHKEENEKFLWGLELGAYSFWVLGTLAGILGGAILLANKHVEPSLTFSITALFFLLMLPNLENYHKIAALTGGILALSFQFIGQTALGILLAGIISPFLVQKIKKVKEK